MISLAQFKTELGIVELQFQKSVRTQRQFTSVNKLTANGVKVKYDVVVSPKLDSTKPKYVTFVEDKNLYVICNAGGITVGDTM